jgi:beta-galactosidase
MLKCWPERGNMSYLNSESTVWNDDAVGAELESAVFWSECCVYAVAEWVL